MQMDESRILFLPYNTTDINEPSVLPYLEEINETPETRAKCLEILRQELKNLKDIDPFLDESFLLMFLRHSKFNTQKTLQRLQSYYQQYDVLFDAFKNCSITVHRAHSFNHVTVSPYRLKNNSMLAIGKISAIDFRKSTFAERFYMELIMTHHAILGNPLNQICGATSIFDFDGLDFHALRTFTPKWIRMWMNLILTASPIRVKAVHVVNTPPLFSSIYNIANPLLPRKIRERVFLHPRNGGWQNLHASIPAKILPKQYGGELSDERMISYVKNVEEIEKNFLKAFAFGTIINQQNRKSFKVIC